jgi:hydrogenase maturation factor
MSDERQEPARKGLVEINTLQEHGEASSLSSLCELDADGHCVTCSDEALPVRVIRVDAESGLALVEVKDTTEEIDVTLVDEVVPGDVLLVHGGVAIGHLGVQGAKLPAGGMGVSPESLPFSRLSEASDKE